MTPDSLPLFRRNVERDGPPLVFIHGIKGSKLVDGDGRLRWLSASTALGLSTPDLRLPIRWKDGRQERDGLRPTEPLDAVEIIPGLLKSQVYGPWLRQAESLGRPLYGFAYDWRRDNQENLARFRECVSAVRARHGGSPVQLVAHSMGGVISLPLLIERPDWFLHVLFATIPFRGGIGFLEDMHAGLPTGRNRKVTSPEMLFTCPSAYTLYPIGRSDCLDSRGNPLPIDFFDPEQWVEHGMGIFADRAQATPDRMEFLRQALESARSLKLLHSFRDQAYPPITVLASRAHPTLRIAVKSGPQAVRGWDFRSHARHPGDGRVCYDHMLPPEGFEYEIVETQRAHSDVLNDPTVLDILRRGASEFASPV
jgi:pimeloyl-ACP methyl ester carboxylesterase